MPEGRGGSSSSSSTRTVGEIAIVVLTIVVATTCFFALELSRGLFVGVNFAFVAIHAYFLGYAVTTAVDDSNGTNAKYSFLSLVVLGASTLLKYARVE